MINVYVTHKYIVYAFMQANCHVYIPFHCFHSDKLLGRRVISEIGFIDSNALSTSLTLFPKYWLPDLSSNQAFKCWSMAPSQMQCI